MTDSFIRELERRAACGDAEAQAQLTQWYERLEYVETPANYDHYRDCTNKGPGSYLGPGPRHILVYRVGSSGNEYIVWVPPDLEEDYDEYGALVGPAGDTYWYTWEETVEWAEDRAEERPWLRIEWQV